MTVLNSPEMVAIRNISNGSGAIVLIDRQTDTCEQTLTKYNHSRYERLCSSHSEQPFLQQSRRRFQRKSLRVFIVQGSIAGDLLPWHGVSGRRLGRPGRLTTWV